MTSRYALRALHRRRPALHWGHFECPTVKIGAVEVDIQHFYQMMCFACCWEAVHAHMMGFRAVTLMATNTIGQNTYH